ncbi:unnamed protein product [Prunus armeniaca]
MWDFLQVTVVVTRVLEIRFGSWELQQVSGTLEEFLNSLGTWAFSKEKVEDWALEIGFLVLWQGSVILLLGLW